MQQPSVFVKFASLARESARFAASFARESAHFEVGALPDSTWFARPSLTVQHGVTLSYLGTAGFTLSHRGHVLVLDPYLTRTGLSTLLRGGKLHPDEAVIRAFVPEAHDVLVGHAHFDHVLDAPALCSRTGARLVGSRAVCHVGRAGGLTEAQLVETTGREDLVCGPFVARGLPSRHGKVVLGRVIFAGDIAVPPAWPPRAAALKHGPVLNWLVRTDGFSLVHIDSADFIPEELHGLRADVLCLCAAGRRYRPRYVEEAIALLKPRFVVPCHWDTMVSPAHMPLRLLPGIDLPGMIAEIRAHGATPLPLRMAESVRF